MPYRLQVARACLHVYLNARACFSGSVRCVVFLARMLGMRAPLDQAIGLRTSNLVVGSLAFHISFALVLVGYLCI